MIEYSGDGVIRGKDSRQEEQEETVLASCCAESVVIPYHKTATVWLMVTPWTSSDKVPNIRSRPPEQISTAHAVPGCLFAAAATLIQ